MEVYSTIKFDGCRFGPSDFCGFLAGYVLVKDDFVVLAILDFLEGLECQANFLMALGI